MDIVPGPEAEGRFRRLYDRVLELRESTILLEQEFQRDIDRVPEEHRASARNLVHYLAIRRQDIRALQIELRNLGLSSLGRLEAEVSAALEAVLTALSSWLVDEPLVPVVTRSRGAPPLREGDERLARHTGALLGPPQKPNAKVRIMVTLPSAAAADYAVVRELVLAGMDVARINTAHDSPEAWERMACNVRAAAAEHGRSIRVMLDLAGPKLRTGAMAPGPAVRRIKPERDARGVVLRPARFRVVPDVPGRQIAGSLPEIPVDATLFDSLREGDWIKLRDAPGRQRSIDIVGRDAAGVLAETRSTTWFESGLRLRLRREGKTIRRGRVGSLPRRPSVITLHESDTLILTADPRPGRDALRDDTGRVTEAARIPCTLPAVFAEVRQGERILFDDGVIAGLIVDTSGDELRIRVTRTRLDGGKLGPDKGINLPDTTLTLPSLTDDDRAALDVAVRIADIVGLSFVRTAADLETLHAALNERHAENLGVIVKIETLRGFQNLPQILLAALRYPPSGVMVARGDLGVEVGFERMSEVQEEILWLCEAAHVPVIWATQVLEGLIKTGMPTRGEVTDAAMGARAECVMLNKGPHVVTAVRFLSDVLSRMLDHHCKKTSMLRRLKVSEGRWDMPGDAEVVAHPGRAAGR